MTPFACDRCGYPAHYGTRPCATCRRNVCPICRVMRFIDDTAHTVVYFCTEHTPDTPFRIPIEPARRLYATVIWGGDA